MFFMISLTILTGFLGVGKTTILKKIVELYPEKKFGFIINEFGEVGIDSALIDSTKEQMVELSNGCLCCVVRGDLLQAIENMVSNNDIDYVFIEASGLAEIQPIVATFASLDENASIKLDSIIAVVDVENFKVNEDTYHIAIEQLQYSDVVLFNKAIAQDDERVQTLRGVVAKLNPDAAIVIYRDDSDLTGLIDSGAWTVDRLLTHNHKRSHHEHEHQHFHEKVFQTPRIFDPLLLDSWLQDGIPTGVIRAKGILQLQLENKVGWFVFQMVGAHRSLVPFTGVEPLQSTIVCIGKHIEDISTGLEKTLMV
jgi:G3E family GTPase